MAKDDSALDVAHELVPKHEKLTKEEAKKILDEYHMTIKEMPKLSASDPAVRNLGVKPGDIVKITRKSYTAGESIFYRGVVDE